MLNENDQRTLKELVPKVGPRLKIKNAFEKTFEKSTSKNKSVIVENIQNSSGSSNIASFIKGQQKLKLGKNGWEMKKMTTEVGYEHYLIEFTICS